MVVSSTFAYLIPFVYGVQVNGFNLENVTHDEAANALKCTQDYVRLLVAKATPCGGSGGNSMSIMSPRRRAPTLGEECQDIGVDY